MQLVRLSTLTSGLYKGITRTSNVTPVFGTTSQRCFSLTALCHEEEKTPETTEEEKTPETAEEEQTTVVEEESEPIKFSRRRRKFHEWVNGEGAKYRRPAKGTTNYLGETPFPTNPLFKPRPPLSDARRQEIYDAFISDPKTWTVRQLATKYGLSLKRVEAILKLKSAEKELEMNGFALQKKFNKGMEQLMGVDHTMELLKEPLIDVFTNIGKPKFKTLKEDASFSPEDAAKELKSIPFRDLEKRIIESEQAEFTLSTTSSASSTATTNTKRSKFLIVDTSS
ncbi:eukaryotic mitochondrial regulator protein-domain-containing protein [Cokeromyces recurvatus]|uniref:eukaryotic mitochondrial regulator protein-domain-containing protein n=1 Tax=Cokeromyces recurvatus TaxID=90255 RepID=UPI0022204D0B|nr:eukaryotic mitochondrial regulator protein-domain-containing protein [Cokeromyces recurvatus]KAI7905942.1 eukaryotic mitochondrial regulator protein-domain-containing protein [Cokeromyces recurvatus]